MFMQVHNQPPAYRTKTGRAFLIKCSAKGLKPKSPSHLWHFARVRHVLQTTGVVIPGPIGIFRPCQGSASRELVHYESLLVRAYNFSYGNDEIDRYQ